MDDEILTTTEEVEITTENVVVSTEVPTEEGGEYDEILSEINRNLSQLNDSLIKSTEDNEVIEDDEENTEVPFTDENIILALEGINDNISLLREEMSEYNREEITEIPSEEPTEEATEEPSTTSPIPDLTFLNGDEVDSRLYLSGEVKYADINDVYSMLLSARNVLILFLMVFIIFKSASIFKNGILKLMK